MEEEDESKEEEEGDENEDDERCSLYQTGSYHWRRDRAPPLLLLEEERERWARALSRGVDIKVDLPPPVHFSICTEGFPYLNISKKTIQFVWERYQNHKFNCVCVFLVS